MTGVPEKSNHDISNEHIDQTYGTGGIERIIWDF